MIIISPTVDEPAGQVAEKLGIEVYSDSLEANLTIGLLDSLRAPYQLPPAENNFSLVYDHAGFEANTGTNTRKQQNYNTTHQDPQDSGLPHNCPC